MSARPPRPAAHHRRGRHALATRVAGRASRHRRTDDRGLERQRSGVHHWRHHVCDRARHLGQHAGRDDLRRLHRGVDLRGAGAGLPVRGCSGRRDRSRYRRQGGRNHRRPGNPAHRCRDDGGSGFDCGHTERIRLRQTSDPHSPRHLRHGHRQRVARRMRRPTRKLPSAA